MLPAFAGVAVKVMELPAYTLLADALIVTDGAGLDGAIMPTVTGFDIAGTLQGIELFVKVQVTTSPLAKLVLLNTGLLLPAFTPFTFH